MKRILKYTLKSEESEKDFYYFYYYFCSDAIEELFLVPQRTFQCIVVKRTIFVLGVNNI